MPFTTGSYSDSHFDHVHFIPVGTLLHQNRVVVLAHVLTPLMVLAPIEVEHDSADPKAPPLQVSRYLIPGLLDPR